MKYLNQRQIVLFRLRLIPRLIFRISKTTNSSSNLRNYDKFLERSTKVDPLFKKALLYANNNNNNALTDFNAQYTYIQLYKNSKILSRQISNICGSGSCSTIAFFTSNDVLTILILWSIWMSGQTAMPLKYDGSFQEHCELITGMKSRLLIAPYKYETLSKELAFENDIALLVLDHRFFNIIKKDNNDLKRQKVTQHNQLFEEFLDNKFYKNSAAFIAHVNDNNSIVRSECKVLNHNDLNYLFRKLVVSWNITETDKILYITPLYQRFHNEFIFNLLFPLSVGGHVIIFDSFDVKSAWCTILGDNVAHKERINVFVAEPNVYLEMINEFDKTFAKDHKMSDYIKEYCQRNIRLMVSCFVDLDPKIFSRWLEITGHSIFETNTLNLLNHLHRKENYSAFLKFPNIRMCVVNSNNQILLELDQISNEIFHNSSKVIIGRLIIKYPCKTFVNSGEIVSYCRGVLTKIGRYNVDTT